MSFFFNSCTNYQRLYDKNINPLKFLIKNDNNFKEALKIIFRDCFEFEKFEKPHPYKDICKKYLTTEFEKFITDFNDNFKIKKMEVASNKNSTGLLTGYYEPAIKAYNYAKEGSYPIYKHPNNVKEQLIDYEVSREIINNGYLKDKSLEIAWVENEIEAFFLHIQGSGRLIFNNNEIIKVRYAGSNKKDYSSLGRILIDHGFLKKENLDMYKIKDWLYKNRIKARRFMNMNERYIFFEEYKGEIKGSARVALVPNISIAVDKRFIKKGEAIIIQNKNDITDTFLGIAHDEGSAIKGNSRIDLFTGFGYKSENKAAVLNKKIFTWKLEPKI